MLYQYKYLIITEEKEALLGYNKGKGYELPEINCGAFKNAITALGSNVKWKVAPKIIKVYQEDNILTQIYIAFVYGDYMDYIKFDKYDSLKEFNIEGTYDDLIKDCQTPLLNYVTNLINDHKK